MLRKIGCKENLVTMGLEIQELLKKYNERFMQNNSHGDELCEEIFEFTDRSSLLILSAPHSTRSFVAKREKMADLYTGALVQYLGEKHQVSTLIRTKYTPFKALISDCVVQKNLGEHYFLDIHGFNQEVGYDICLGTGEFSEEAYPYLQDIVNIAHQFGLKAVINHPNYMGKIGLTGRYQKFYNKPNVIQVELKQHLRDFYGHFDVVENITLPFFEQIIRQYQANE